MKILANQDYNNVALPINLPTPVSDGDAARKKYVDDQIALAVSGVFDYQGVIDCSANPNFPAATQGWVYVVSVAGKIGGASGEVVEPGDFILCKTTNGGGTEGSVGADFDVIQHNLDQATETILGTVKLATSAQALAGTDDLSAITSLKLQAKIASYRYAQNIGDGAATSFVIPHGLNTLDVVVQIKRVAAPGDFVGMDVTNPTNDLNNITVSSLTIPTTNQYRVIVKA